MSNTYQEKRAILNRLVGGFMRNVGQYKRIGPFSQNYISALITPAATTALGYGAGWLGDKLSNDEDDEYRWRKRLGIAGLGTGLALDAIYNTPFGGSKTAEFTKRALMDYYSDYSGRDDIPVGHSVTMLYNDPVLSLQEKAQATQYLMDANNYKPRGMISPTSLTQAAIGAGVGYGAATLFSKAMNGIFGGLPTSTQKKLQTAGVIGGILLNTGAL